MNANNPINSPVKDNTVVRHIRIKGSLVKRVEEAARHGFRSFAEQIDLILSKWFEREDSNDKQG